ncbi:MAG: hypothetical protein KC731_24235 [Myxococcales bacterium]|nr:hypothetical protein [Myxococcales bacterium]
MKVAKVGTVLGFGWLVALLVPIGCGGVDESEPQPDPNETEQGFCAALAEVICSQAVVEACYLSDSSTLAADTESCVERASRASVCNPAGLPYDKSGAQSCLAATKAMYGDAKLGTEELEAQRRACLKAFSRGGDAGTACVVDEDCDGAGGLRCVKKVTGEASCQIPKEVGGGADCSAADAVCGEGFYCSESANCVAREAVNEACSDLMLCVEDAICTADVCLAKKANSTLCAEDSECLGGFCIKKTGENTGQCGGFIPVDFDSAVCGLLTP